MIKKEIIKHKEQKIVRQAHWKEIDTGVRRVTTIIDKDGNKTDEERPVMERAFIPAQYEEVEKPKEVFVIEHKGERHEFATEADAKNYKRSIA